MSKKENVAIAGILSKTAINEILESESATQRNIGQQVEHEMKELACEILPERYNVRAITIADLSIVNGQPLEKNIKTFTLQEMKDKKFAFYIFLQNLRDGRDVGKGNPYNNILGFAKEEGQGPFINMDGEFSVIKMYTKFVDVFGKKTVECITMAVSEYDPNWRNQAQVDDEEALASAIITKKGKGKKQIEELV